ncbi:Glycoside hydrolase/deacetylase, beta/alpha-barrel [Penicillium italicum]|uniref:Glycoside hydrolase/deacetylase, beta/alpha-barrel n=1 Tax=Penicillium italicum TaxID=40296 RepID=A0A0A2KJ64_PENIT|nr:Glycoside hydrolase/deacetylase, beta/alpha-barrel [Penicillium italicum]
MHFLAHLIPFLLSAITLSEAAPTGNSINTNTTANTTNNTQLNASKLPVGAILTHCTTPGTIALTFDDGPYIYTPQILDTLAEHGARATFFLNGHNRGHIYASPEIVQRTLMEGHQLGSHTWNHLSLDTLPYDEIVDQMTILEEAFIRILGFFPTYMRPPFLRHTPVVLGAMADLGYHVIGASVDTKDYENDNPDTNWISFEKFKREVDAGGTIVLAHDAHQYTVEILVDNMLAHVERRGLSAVTVGECLGDPSEYWYRTGRTQIQSLSGATRTLTLETLSAEGKRRAISPAPGSLGTRKKTARDNKSDGESLSAADKDTASLNIKSLKAARQTKETSFRPVDLGGKDWLKTEGQEAMLAAYLGFTNTTDLRKFAISWVCLAAEKYFRESAKGMRKDVPFMLLSNPVNKSQFAGVTTAPETVWPYKETDEDAQKNVQKRWIVAWCLFKMASDVDVYNENTLEENERRTKLEQAEFLERHTSEFARLDLTFPSETVGFPSPNLGPLKDTPENELEVFNRCWEVLRYLAFGLFKSNWKKRFGSTNAISNGTTVNQSNFPTWMQTPDKTVQSGLGTIGAALQTDKLSPVKVMLRWIRDARDPRNEETEQAIRDAELRGIPIPTTDQVLPWDPRLCTSACQFRDKIRRFLGCRELGLNLQVLRLKFYNIAEDLYFDQDASYLSLDELRDSMSNPANYNFLLWVKLEPFDTQDPLANIFEDTEFPAEM